MARPSPDRPTTEDRLNFRSYVLPITRTIRDAARADQLPLTIGIFGRWGSGKTSLMRMVEQELGPTPEERRISDQRSQAAQRALRWMVPILIVWLLLILAGLFSTLVAALWVQAYTGLGDLQSQVLWASAMFGAFGGWVAAFYVVWARAVIEQDLEPKYILNLALRPLTGLLAGVLVFFLLSGGDSLFASARLAGLNRTVYILLAFVSGFSNWLDLLLSARLSPWIERLRRRNVKQAKQAVDRKATAQRVETRGDYQVIWFNAWKFANEDELWAALLQEVLRQIKVKAVGRERLRIKWQLWKRSIDWSSGFRDVARKLLPAAGKTLLAAGFATLGGLVAAWAVSSRYGEQIGQTAGAVGAVLTGLLPISAWLRANLVTPLADLDLDKYRKKASYKDHLTFLAEFSNEFRGIARIARGDGNPLVLMLDDLDRCLPEQAVSVLEAIKLFISEDAPVAFMIGADQEFIERAIEVKYEKMIARTDTDPERRERFARLGREYLEKIVQLSFHLPPIEEGLIDSFIDDVFKDNTWVVDHSHIFAAGLQPNPRQVLRVLNIYNFMIELAQEKKWLYAKIIQPDVLAKAVVVQYRWPELWRRLESRLDLLAAIEKFFREGAVPTDAALAAIVETFAKEADLRNLLTVKESGSLAGVDLRKYIYLSESTQTRPEQEEKPTQPPEKVPVKRVRRKAPTQEDEAAESLNVALEKTTQALGEVNRLRPAWRQLGISQRRITTYENRLKRALTDKDLQAAQTAQSEFQKVLETSQAGRVQKIEQRRVELRQKVKELGSGGADSALLGLMEDYLERAAKAIEANDLEMASVHLEDAESLAGSAQADLAARKSDEVERKIEARLSKDGRLVFERAVTYQPVEIRMEIPGREKDGEIIAYSPRGENRSPVPGLRGRLWDVKDRILQGEVPAEDSHWLRVQLGEALRPVLQLADPASPDNFRLRLSSVNQTIDDLPWEMALTSEGHDLPLGLDPRLAVVRGAVTPTSTPPLDLERLQPKMLVFYLGADDSSPLTLLRQIRFPFEVQFLSGLKRPEIYAIFQKERPILAHWISAEVSTRQTGKGSTGINFNVSGFDVEIDPRDAGLMVFDFPGGQDMARALVGYGMPAALSWQLGVNDAAAGAFYYPFYNALLRSGQPEFAVTEGRRAIAAALGDDSPLALSPVLYLAGSAQPA